LNIGRTTEAVCTFGRCRAARAWRTIDVMSSLAALRIEPLTSAIGAVVDGIDLTDRLTDGDLRGLRVAIHRHRVVFLRDQHLSLEEHRRLGERLGPLAVSPLHQLLGTARTVSTIMDDAEHPPAGFDWHSDLSWTAAPPSLGILSAVEIPSVGGDTLWASLPAALAALPAAMHTTCRELRADHAADATLLESVERHHGPEVAVRLRRANPPVSHPLVRTHPVTGEALLFLSPLYLQRLIGIERRQGDRMLRALNGLLEDPHVQVRWRWQAGDVAIWDEAATCHRALTDHYPQRRTMRRCVVQGDRPR
jgi:alpha-ketoglutarate-dependent taurine dioxygenase